MKLGRTLSPAALCISALGMAERRTMAGVSCGRRMARRRARRSSEGRARKARAALRHRRGARAREAPGWASGSNATAHAHLENDTLVLRVHCAGVVWQGRVTGRLQQLECNARSKKPTQSEVKPAAGNRDQTISRGDGKRSRTSPSF